MYKTQSVPKEKNRGRGGNPQNSPAQGDCAQKKRANFGDEEGDKKGVREEAKTAGDRLRQRDRKDRELSREDRLKSFKLFFPVNNPGCVRI